MARALATVLDKPGVRDRLSSGAIATARDMSLDAHASGLEAALLQASRQSPSALQVSARR
jgi:hypothetical protein